jgi:hypothetical protein
LKIDIKIIFQELKAYMSSKRRCPVNSNPNATYRLAAVSREEDEKGKKGSLK